MKFLQTIGLRPRLANFETKKRRETFETETLKHRSLYTSRDRHQVSIAAMSNPPPAGRMRPNREFCAARPSLGFGCGKSIPHTDNLSLFW